MAGNRTQQLTLLGLGLMGEAMARRLLNKRFALTVWNRTTSKSRRLGRLNATVASTPMSAASGSKVVALCLLDAGAVEEVLFGRDGAARSLGKTSIVLDFSTLGIESTRRLAQRVFEETGASWVDAPVSGGPSGALAGTLAIYCGGSTRDVRRVTPILTALGRRSTHFGPVGSGQAAKLCNQLISASAMLAVSESIQAAKAFGLDARKIPVAFAGGYADSLPLQIFGPRMASRKLKPRISEIGTMRKDVKEVLAALKNSKSKLPFLKAVSAIYERAMRQGLGREDLGALIRLR